MESVQQEENGADANHPAQNEGVPPFPQVDPLDEVVDRREAVFGGQLKIKQIATEYKISLQQALNSKTKQKIRFSLRTDLEKNYNLPIEHQQYMHLDLST